MEECNRISIDFSIALKIRAREIMIPSRNYELSYIIRSPIRFDLEVAILLLF